MTLRADSSLTAEPFYRVNGYEICESSDHVLNNGARMACVRISKSLVPFDPSTSERRDQSAIPSGEKPRDRAVGRPPAGAPFGCQVATIGLKAPAALGDRSGTI